MADQPPPAETLGAGTPLRQGYVAIDAGVTVRVRIAPDRAWLTIKAGGDELDRTEVEVALDPAEAEDLWEHTRERRLEKTRHHVPVDDLTAEVDVFGGSTGGAVPRRGRVRHRCRSRHRLRRPGVVRERGHRTAGVEQRVARPTRPPRHRDEPMGSGVRRDRLSRGGDVATAELDRVDDERGDLVQGDPIAPAVRQRVSSS